MKFTNSKGFTLVELMVVVAIIGVLSAVAIPNFKKYQAKSKTTEAKLNLAAIYTNMLAFQADYDLFSGCLTNMGYDAPGNSYYALGFGAAAGNEGQAASNGATGCDAAPGNEFGYDAGRAAGGQTPILHTAMSGYTSINATEFIAGASGIISADAGTTDDRWTINQNKVLNHAQPGY